MKLAFIFENPNGVYGVEYDNTVGKRHTMRLEATSYEAALRETRLFLGIQPNDRDEAGDRWQVE